MEQQPAQSAVSEGIQFAEWATSVDSDDLFLAQLRYGSSEAAVSFAKEGFTLELPESAVEERGALEATFLSRQKRAVVVFSFEHVSAFRVLDEHGLLDIWDASGKTARPACTTFRVKGHKWQEESFLSWSMPGCDFSFMIATDEDCLEVVASSEPTIRILPAKVTEHEPSMEG